MQQQKQINISRNKILNFVLTLFILIFFINSISFGQEHLIRINLLNCPFYSIYKNKFPDKSKYSFPNSSFKSFDNLSNKQYSILNNSLHKIKSLQNTGKSSGFFEGLDVNVKGGYLKEIEENYSTSSVYQNLKLGKRFSDLFMVTLSTGIENAKRVEVNQPDRKKWYDNTILNTEFDFNERNSISLFGSGSLSDSTFTSYGFALKSGIDLDKIIIKNYLTLSYDYFYYWTQVGQYYASDNVDLNYKDLTISAGYFSGVVDFNFVDGFEDKAKNPNSNFSFEIRYKILKKPAIDAGLQYSSKGFKYYSPLYYSPTERKLSGINATFYNTFGSYFLYMGSGIKVDNNNIFIWDADGEAGYFTNNFSLSLSLSRYNDPFYTSYNSFLNITKSF
ncbi:MAG: hypothetical protein ABI792_06585 [bacterium]